METDTNAPFSTLFVKTSKIERALEQALTLADLIASKQLIPHEHSAQKTISKSIEDKLPSKSELKESVEVHELRVRHVDEFKTHRISPALPFSVVFHLASDLSALHRLAQQERIACATPQARAQLPEARVFVHDLLAGSALYFPPPPPKPIVRLTLSLTQAYPMIFFK